MAANILLKNLFALSRSMKRGNFDYQVINDIKYKEDLEICALFKFDYVHFKDKKYDDNSAFKEYMLGLFKRKTNEYLHLPLIHKITTNFEVFELPTMLEGDFYMRLREFLEIEYSIDGKFKPIDFFKALNDAIPTRASEYNLDRKVCSYSYPTSKDNEKEKVYFSHFLDNDKSNKKRSLENYEKTQKLLPYANKMIGKSNISVCFTDAPRNIAEEKLEISNKMKSINNF